jgi:hypothetical protein
VGWVVGVWFGFASRCVALLCGVFVRLHLALFPAGGPFLPSLCVNRYKYHAGCASGLLVLVPDAPALALVAASALPADLAPSHGPGAPSRSPDPLCVPPHHGPGAQGDVMFMFPRRLVVGDFSSSTRRLPPLLGRCAYPRVCGRCPDASKRRANRQVSFALPFVPMSVESFEPLGPQLCRCLGTWPTRQCRLAGLGSLGSPSSRGRTGSLALPFAGATRPCVVRARTSRRVPLAGPRCAFSPGPRLRLFRPVPRPVFEFGVVGSASLCVA